MTKQQFQRAKGEIARARKDPAFSPTLVTDSAMMLRAAWGAQQVMLAKRSKITSREIDAFCGRV